MNSTTGLCFLPTILGALLCAVAAQAARAAVIDHHITLLDVWNANGSDQILETAAGATALGPGLIVGVYPVTRGSATEARGFTVTNPVGPPVPATVKALMIPTGQLTWIQPYDVNSSGVYVGQARGSHVSGPLYASSSRGPLPGLNSGSIWAASAATSINNNGVMVGWKQQIGGAEQAFYYSGGPTPQDIKNITIDGAASSRALSVNTPDTATDPTLVAGYFRPQNGNGNPHGFVYNINSGKVTDIGRVVIPTIEPFDQAHYVSVNADGVVAATRPVPADSLTSYQAFVMDGQGHSTSIRPIGPYEDTFATGISDTGWVVGVLRDREGAESGFLWVAGQTIDLSLYAMTDGWMGTTWALDVYSGPIGANGLQTGTVVGMGTFIENGVSRQRAFAMQITMQVPEPQTYLMLGLGLLAIGALRMRRIARP